MKALCRPLLMLLTLLALTNCDHYNCPDSSPCFAQAQVPLRHVESFGAFVNVDGSIDSLYNSSVSNSVSIFDYINNGCTSIGPCYITLGYFVDFRIDFDPHFFWAYRLPNSMPVFQDLGKVPSIYFSRKVLLVIRKTGPDTWAASVYPPAEREEDPVLTVSTAGLPMDPLGVTIGMELVGTGFKSPLTGAVTFTGNAFKVATSPFIFILTNDGYVRSDNPPSGTWLTRPSARTSSGGIFQTKCCN